MINLSTYYVKDLNTYVETMVTVHDETMYPNNRVQMRGTLTMIATSKSPRHLGRFFSLRGYGPIIAYLMLSLGKLPISITYLTGTLVCIY